MRNLAWVNLAGGAALALLSGCGVELLASTATEATLQAKQMQAVKGQLDYAKRTVGRVNVEEAIKIYSGEKGAPPPTLDALVPQWLPSMPSKPDGSPYFYNAASGRLVDSPSPTPEDTQIISRVKDAINRYGTAVGYYPNTLDDLVPAYLPTLPRTSAGERFVYSNQNGFVGHPRANAPLSFEANAPHAPVATGGPLGEATAGIGISNQLDNMSSAGSSSVGTRSRQNIGDIGENRTAQQNAAMDQLGL